RRSVPAASLPRGGAASSRAHPGGAPEPAIRRRGPRGNGSARCSTALAFGHRGVELLDLLDEAVDRVEVAVDAQEADVRHAVEVVQELQHPPPDLFAGDLRSLDLVFERVRERAQLLLADGALVARDPQLGEELVGVEGLETPGALPDHQGFELGAFVGGEAPQARGALTPSADRGAFVGGAGVDDAGVVRGAVRTPHALPRGPRVMGCSASSSSSTASTSSSYSDEASSYEASSASNASRRLRSP